MMTTVSHAVSPMLNASSRGARGCAGSTSQISRCGLRRPAAQISLRAPSIDDERVVVRDAIAAVLADRARGRVLAQVGNDAQDLADERVEPLRIQPADVALLARAGVADADVHDAPVGIAAASGRIERHLAERMNRRWQLQPQQLARGAFERRVRGCCGRSTRSRTFSRVIGAAADVGVTIAGVVR